MIDCAFFATNQNRKARKTNLIRVRNWLIKRILHSSLSCLVVTLAIFLTTGSRKAIDEIDRSVLDSPVKGTATLIGFKLLDCMMYSMLFSAKLFSASHLLSATHISTGIAVLSISLTVVLIRNVIQERLARTSRISQGNRNAASGYQALSLS